jgi:hypothetical protein
VHDERNRGRFDANQRIGVSGRYAFVPFAASIAMTTQRAVILTAIAFAFVLFGAVLAWADFYVNRAQKPGVEGSYAGNEGPGNLLDLRRAA